MYSKALYLCRSPPQRLFRQLSQRASPIPSPEMTTQPYRIRPGFLSDVPHAVDIYMVSFANEGLIDILFPNRHTRPEALIAYVSRLFHSRWWSPNYDMHVLVGDADGRPVGFTWWKRPNSQLSFCERWISPCRWTAAKPKAKLCVRELTLYPDAWFSPIVQAFFSLRDKLFPIPNLDEHAAGTFLRAFKDTEPRILGTPRRKSAWYLSTLGVRPELQGKGLGSLLLRNGLQRVDQRGAAAWLIGVEGVDAYYERHGFVEVARANVGELQHWGGGSVMFRNE